MSSSALPSRQLKVPDIVQILNPVKLKGNSSSINYENYVFQYFRLNILFRSIYLYHFYPILPLFSLTRQLSASTLGLNLLDELECIITPLSVLIFNDFVTSSSSWSYQATESLQW